MAKTVFLPSSRYTRDAPTELLRSRKLVGATDTAKTVRQTSERVGQFLRVVKGAQADREVGGAISEAERGHQNAEVRGPADSAPHHCGVDDAVGVEERTKFG